MSDFGTVLVSRSDIARLAGVQRPAITNWERRHGDFPAPAAGDPAAGEPEKFRADEVLAWLSGRKIPANALRPGESAGTTYGDRFRAGLTGSRPGGLVAAVRQLAGPEADRFRGRLPLTDYLILLLTLVSRQAEDPAGWRHTADRPGFAREAGLPEQEITPQRTATLVEFLDRNPPGSAKESREAYSYLLTRLRDIDAREGGAYLTPPSVTRVMARALARAAAGASHAHDPFCRVGELLTAYLDAVAEHGGTATVSGETPTERELRLARMNVRLYGGDPAQVVAGPGTPAAGSAAPVPRFDVILTNPPFGIRVPDDRQPPYWTYGPARRTEWDWIQYVAARLAPGGRAAVLMPAGAAFNEGAAAAIRAGLVEAGLVECVMALPAGLFALTGVKTHIWFLHDSGSPPAADAEVLFVAGEHLGHRATRTQWALSDEDSARLVDEYVRWCEARAAGSTPAGTPGLSRAVSLRDIAGQAHRLDPALHVRALGADTAAPTDPAAVRRRLAELGHRIRALQARAEASDAEAARLLRRYGL
ncbi:N-6 DNA methylase [Streptomyces echinoruber]|uniref:DNA methylase adenine-specific domain-containing protein n=1 Tax=Streptomyces echinoruber TaxID=68898 RepID=A0A918RQL7_9ACTN|nr:N-6 DNA methylase [Streptomyces echinoruber]GHA09246.1 hypothetical protein GCM10010389_55420 [Streptomyces echinoruber]